MFKVFIKNKDHVLRKEVFNSPIDAEKIFNEWSKERTDNAQSLILTSGNTTKKYFRLDKAYPDKARFITNENILTS